MDENYYSVQKILFRIEEVRGIILDFSKGKLKILEISAKIV